MQLLHERPQACGEKLKDRKCKVEASVKWVYFGKCLFCVIPPMFIHVLFVLSAEEVVGKSILKAR